MGLVPPTQGEVRQITSPTAEYHRSGGAGNGKTPEENAHLARPPEIGDNAGVNSVLDTQESQNVKRTKNLGQCGCWVSGNGPSAVSCRVDAPSLVGIFRCAIGLGIQAALTFQRGRGFFVSQPERREVR